MDEDEIQMPGGGLKQGEDSGSSVWTWIIIVVGVLGAVLATGWFVMQRYSRKHKSPTLENQASTRQPMLEDVQFASIDIPSSMEALNADKELNKRFIPYDQLRFDKVISSSDRSDGYTMWQGTNMSVPVTIMSTDENLDAIQEQIPDYISNAKYLGILSHPNILPYLGCSWKSSYRLCAVSENPPTNTLHHTVLDKAANKNWDSKIRMMCDIASALRYLHDLNSYYNKLSPDYIYVNELNRVQLSPFECKQFTTSIHSNIAYGRNAIRWLSPEVLRLEVNSNPFASNMYSFGVIMSMIINEQEPYQEHFQNLGTTLGEIQLAQKIKTRELTPSCIPKDTPLPLSDLVSKCTSGMPTNRPTAAQVLIILENLLIAI